MERSDLKELQYITPIINISSIMRHGVLSHDKAKKYQPVSIAMPEIQLKRSKKKVPRANYLHSYVNLYFHARNPMMYKRREQHKDLTVLRINADVLDLEGVVIADGNAVSDYTKFLPSPSGLAGIDKDRVYTKNWWDEDEIVKFRNRRIKCAEVLVPNKVNPEYILGAYVSCKEAEECLASQNFTEQISINPNLFFR